MLRFCPYRRLNRHQLWQSLRPIILLHAGGALRDTQPDTQPVPSSHLTLTGHALKAIPADGNYLQAGVMVGPYRLSRPLGSGGMGHVWLAEQTAPLKREVAVKMLSRSLNDRMAEAWFLVERQALAMLVHPYIAQIFDAGQLPGGTMFFAMEYIEGSTLDQWVSEQSPSLPTVVELFERICAGMQHAHQRGLIHRDLKPANLLVRDEGGQVLPKIIDFGVAVGGVPGQQVQIDQKVTIGTAAYMAPEQARPTTEGIDARVDVYALGATLANILCQRAGLDIEIKQALSHIAASLTRTGAQPPGELAGKPTLQVLRRTIPTELRAIAVKAMAADRQQRYESVAALGADLQRWRMGQPVLAMRGGRAYALRCFVRRYRWASIAAALAVVALLVGIGVALYGLGQARNARHIAEQRRVQAEDLVGVMLGDLAEKLRPLGRLDLLETVGDQAMTYLRAAAATEGSTAGAVQRARALRTLGEVYVNRKQMDLATEAFEEAQLALDNADELVEDELSLLYERGRAAYWLGYLSFLVDDYAATERLWLEHLDLAEKQKSSASDDSGLLENAYVLHNLGALSLKAGDLSLARSRFDQAIELQTRILRERGDDADLRMDLANSISSLGSTLQARGLPREALGYFERQVALLGNATERTPIWKNRYGIALRLEANLRFEVTGQDTSKDLVRAIGFLREAADSDASNLVWARSLFSAESDFGWLQVLLGRPRDGLEILSATVDKNRHLLDGGTNLSVLETTVRALNRVAAAHLLVEDDATAASTIGEFDTLIKQAPDTWLESPFASQEIAVHEVIKGFHFQRVRRPEESIDSARAALLRMNTDVVTELRLESLRVVALAARLAGESGLSEGALRRAEDLGYDGAAARRLLSRLN